MIVVVFAGTPSREVGRLLNSTTQQCDANTPYCFALWLADASGQSRVLTLFQGKTSQLDIKHALLHCVLQHCVHCSSGCWNYHGGLSCDEGECVARQPPKGNLPNTTRFCCCHGDFCNRRVIDNVSMRATSNPSHKPSSSDEALMGECTASSPLVILQYFQ